MANETVITVVGNLTGDPELRTIASGAQVVNFTVASSASLAFAGCWVILIAIMESFAISEVT